MPVFIGGRTWVTVGQITWTAQGGGLVLRSDSQSLVKVSRTARGSLLIGETTAPVVEGRSYIAIGGLNLASDIDVTVTAFGFISQENTVWLVGVGEVTTPAFSYYATGSVYARGTSGPILHAETGGLVRVSGAARIISDNYFYATSGNLLFSGQAEIVEGYRQFAMLGSVAVAGTAEVIRGFHVFEGTGTTVLLGNALSFFGFAFSHNPTGYLSVVGAADIVQGFHLFTAAGNIQVLGTAGVPRYGLRYPLVVSGRLYLRGSAFEQIKLFVATLRSEWHVKGEITAREEFTWNNRGALVNGHSILYWFRVTSECLPIGCDTIGVQVLGDTDNCMVQEPQEGQEQGGQLVRWQQTLTATDVADLCYRLKQTYLAYPIKWKVKKIEKFIRPVYSDEGSSMDCQIIEEETSFCSIPECMELCLMGLGDAEVPMGINAYLIPVTKYVSNVLEPLYISGRAAASILPYKFTVGGKVTITGRAEYIANAYAKTGSLKNRLTGVAILVSSAWKHTSSGTLRIFGTSNKISSFWRRAGYGEISFEGSSSVWVSRRFLPTTKQIYTTGSATYRIQVARFISAMDGRFSVGTETSVFCSAWQHTMKGRVQIRASNLTKSTNCQKIASGSIILESSWRRGCRYVASSSIRICGFSRVGLSYVGRGNLTSSGQARVTGPNFLRTALGGLRYSGVGVTRSSDLGEFEAAMGMNAFIDYHQFVYRESIYDPLVWPTNDLDVATRCSCSPVPQTLFLNNAFDRLGGFSEFLRRNKFSLPAAIPLKYSTISSKWDRNYHFHGTGLVDGVYEKWILRVEWFCANNVVGDFTGESLWQLMIMLRRSTVYDSNVSKILINIIDSNAICRANAFEFTWNYSPRTATFSVNKNLTINGNVVDEIGIFSGEYWRNRELKTTLADRVVAQTVPTTSIEQFLPAKQMTIFGRS